MALSLGAEFCVRSAKWYQKRRFKEIIEHLNTMKMQVDHIYC